MQFIYSMEINSSRVDAKKAARRLQKCKADQVKPVKVLLS